MGIDGSWNEFSETYVRGIHGPFELEFMPVSPRGFALFTQQDIDQEGYGKGLNFFTMMHFCY